MWTLLSPQWNYLLFVLAYKCILDHIVSWSESNLVRSGQISWANFSVRCNGAAFFVNVQHLHLTTFQKLFSKVSITDHGMIWDEIHLIAMTIFCHYDVKLKYVKCLLVRNIRENTIIEVFWKSLYFGEPIMAQCRAKSKLDNCQWRWPKYELWGVVSDWHMVPMWAIPHQLSYYDKKVCFI